MTALFFAAYPPDEKGGALWAMNPHLLNDRLMGSAGILLPGLQKGAAELFKRAFNGEELGKDKIAAVQPFEVDFRMLLQLSRFTIHDTKTPIEGLVDDEAILRKYLIAREAKVRISSELEALGFRRSSLFPDLDTLAAGLAELRFKETPGAKGSPAINPSP